ncbi:hypothetical protein BV22DRAFT_1135454 [Leucogyrophana mollusca]|uniref:Uncharacterized protein n=1 Tax=Leucogyrophana mollusca TaxID=85980 RepID=A0ACB8AVW1_9AGAM|nr:hypothetical protein BV22DRAFT_1135454 [Leucogyrophana mollusca]
MSSPRTPPPAPLMTPDTVPRPRHTSGAAYRTGDLILGKTAVLKDLGSIPIVSLDYFQEAVLPPLPLQITTSSIKTSLIDQNKLTREGKWAAFQNDPKDDSRREEHAFGPLASAFNSVIEEALKLVNSPSTLKFVQNPSTAPKSQRTNTSRPDAYLLMINKKSFEQHADVLNPRDSWDDIVVSFEYKKNDGKDDRIDNEQKLIWSLHHIMHQEIHTILFVLLLLCELSGFRRKVAKVEFLPDKEPNA